MPETNLNTWPIYFKDNLIVGDLNSNVAIATLWTPKKLFSDRLDKSKYCVIGQLYTKRGVNFLLRNVLAHPTINTIIICGQDLMESSVSLKGLVENGVEQLDDGKLKVIGVESGYIDEQISLEAIELFRKNVKIVDLTGTVKFDDVEKAVLESFTPACAGRSGVLEWAKPQIFSDPDPASADSFPSELNLMKIQRPTIGQAWVQVLKHMLKFGRESEPVLFQRNNGSIVKELNNLCVVVDDECPEDPQIYDFFNFTKTDLENYYKGFFNPKRNSESYTYGERIFNYFDDLIPQIYEKKLFSWFGERTKEYLEFGGYNQLEHAVIRKLKRFKFDKGALISLWNPLIDNFNIKDRREVPCLVQLQFAVFRYGDKYKLHLTAYFRTNDMFGAWPLNAFALRKLQKRVVDELPEVDSMGPLITISSIAQLYEDAFAPASEIVKKNDKYFCKFDERGNYTVEVVGDEIKVIHISPTGLPLNEYIKDGKENKVAMKLCNEIINNEGISDLGAAADLGRQLAKAETAVKLGLIFEQDQPLRQAQG